MLRVDENLISFYEIVHRLDVAGYITVLILVTESTGKVSLDRNTRYNSIHHIHGNFYYSLFLLLFTVYTITVTVTVLNCYCQHIAPVF